MPEIALYHIDAFAERLFEGNPAAVCPLDAWLPDALMQAMAGEHNLAETAFFVREGEGYRLRWFTPLREVRLCGHATLASAHVIFTHLEPGTKEVRFETLSGALHVRRLEEGRLVMDFPAIPARAAPVPDGLEAALGAPPSAFLEGENMMAVFALEADVAALAPDMSRLAPICAAKDAGLVATAQADTGAAYDVASRFFAPAHGVAEDSATGSAHCMIAPYWAARLGQDELLCRQISARGATLLCRPQGARVFIEGACRDYFETRVNLPAGSHSATAMSTSPSATSA